MYGFEQIGLARAVLAYEYCYAAGRSKQYLMVGPEIM